MSAESRYWLETGRVGCCHIFARLIQELRHPLQFGRNDGTNTQQHLPHPTSTKPPRNRIKSRRRPPAIPPQPLTCPLPQLDHSDAAPPANHKEQSRHQAENSLTPSWPLPQRPPVHPSTIHLPDDVLRSIFEFAAADLGTACALALVATHVRTWVDPILYSRVRLVGIDAIRLFARTIEGSFLAGATASTINDNDTSDDLQTRIYKPLSFFRCVHSLAIIPQEERVLLFFRDALRSANNIIAACSNVVELEASGDFLRRTGVSAELLEAPEPLDGESEQSTRPNSAGPSTPISMLQGLEHALMRPLYLTLVPPIQNVNFRLSILSNLTHLHYSSTLPRNLNYQGSLLTLTHVAFDYPEGVATTRAETLMQLLHSALAWGVPPTPLEDEAPSTDPPTVEDGQSLSSSDEQEPSSSHLERKSSQPQLPRRLTQIIVRIILRPRVKDGDRTSEVSRQLVRLSQTDFRLVYFESRGLFGEDIWERAKVAATARERRSISWYRDSLS